MKTNTPLCMQIVIDDTKKIEAVQAVFSKEFPYLKIMFFSKPHSVGGGSSKKLAVDNSLTLKECRKKQNSGVIEIEENMKVSEVETMFWNQFGLSVQIFRKSGSSWLETTATDSWTLEKQNRLGNDISNFKKREEPEEFDNDRTK
ncbi:MAG: hypothetical protein ACHQF2_01585 [Flavobacteriales bacterium]